MPIVRTYITFEGELIEGLSRALNSGEYYSQDKVSGRLCWGTDIAAAVSNFLRYRDALLPSCESQTPTTDAPSSHSMTPREQAVVAGMKARQATRRARPARSANRT